LPLFLIPLFLGKQRKLWPPICVLAYATPCLKALDFLHDNNLGDLGRSPRNSVLDSEHFSNFCGACVGAAENVNNSAAQKEILKWHWKLGIGIYHIQEMMRERHYEDPDGRTTILPAIIQPKNPSAKNCIVPPC